MGPPASTRRPTTYARPKPISITTPPVTAGGKHPVDDLEPEHRDHDTAGGQDDAGHQDRPCRPSAVVTALARPDSDAPRRRTTHSSRDSSALGSADEQEQERRDAGHHHRESRGRDPSPAGTRTSRRTSRRRAARRRRPCAPGHPLVRFATTSPGGGVLPAVDDLPIRVNAIARPPLGHDCASGLFPDFWGPG